MVFRVWGLLGFLVEGWAKQPVEREGVPYGLGFRVFRHWGSTGVGHLRRSLDFNLPPSTFREKHRGLDP